MWQSHDEVDALLQAAAHEHYRRLGRGRACRPPATPDEEQMEWAVLAEQGWLGLVVPEAWGGAGLDLMQAATLARVMGEHVAREPYIACGLMPGLMARALGTPLGASLGQEIARGERRFVLAWQEGPAQLAFLPTEATVVADGDGFRLNGRKTFVSGWQAGATMLVTALQDGAPVLLRVLADERISAELRTMADGSINADVTFANLNIANVDVLARGPVVTRALRASLDGSLLVLCAYLEGLAAGALALTVDYARQRKQFDQPIAEFQAIRHRIANVAMGVELAGASWRRALTDLAHPSSQDTMPWTLSAAKVRAGEAALLASREGIQFHGAFGYTEEADIGLYLDAALRAAAWLGNAADHRLRVALCNPPALSIHA